ncbi:hypothetical protein CMK11_08270 [Candidatus Poribacteria bacterium]|nr:hypothetical protein [Candidatus Poribacteria bacterium]
MDAVGSRSGRNRDKQAHMLSIPRALWLSAVILSLAICTPVLAADSMSADGESESVLERLPKLPKIARKDLPSTIVGIIEKVEAAPAAMRADYLKLLASAGKPGVSGLVHMLASKDANLRWESVSALARTKGSPVAVDAIRATLRDDNWGVRSEAALALGRAGEQADKSILREVAVSDDSDAVRKAALRGLEKLQHRAVTGKEPKNALEASTDTRPTALPNPGPAGGQMLVDPLTPDATTAPVDPSAGAAMGAAMAPSADVNTGTTTEDAGKPVEIVKPGGGAMNSMRPARRRDPIAMPAEVALLPLTPGMGMSQGAARTGEPVTDEAVKTAARRIDEFVNTKAQAVGLEISPRARAGAFLRRTWLDLTGVIPPSTVAAEFTLAGGGADRSQVIDDLVGSEEYLDHWADVWTVWLAGRFDSNNNDIMLLRAWFRDQLGKKTPYDEMVRELLTTAGPTHQVGSAQYMMRYDLDPEELTARTSRTFLGLPMQCAQCHDHKSEPWTQEDFYGVVAFFNSIEREQIYEDVERNGRTEKRYIGSYLRDREIRQANVPDTDVSVEPAFLDKAPFSASAARSARMSYADWMTDPSNPYFAKATVNRIWSYFTGAGIVDPIDWFGVNTRATHPALLEWLAEDFVAHGYDLRYLARSILNTEMYQRSAKTTDRNQNDTQYLTHARIRPLTAEQLFYSLLEATNIESRKRRRQENVEAMKRDYLRRFRFVFGNDEMEEDEINKATISQALMLLNGAIVNDGSIAKDGTRLDRILRTRTDAQRRIDAIFLAILSRKPTGEERSYFRTYLQGSGYRDKNKAFEDLYWSLLNSAEFASNH